MINSQHESDSLLTELDLRLQRDYARLRRRRYIHRSTGVFYNLVLVGGPAVLAVGLTSSSTKPGKALLLGVAVVGGLNAAFRPYLNSQRRRVDINDVRHLRDRFRVDVVRATDDAQKLAVFEKYAAKFATMYSKRGKQLMEASADQEDVGTGPN